MIDSIPYYCLSVVESPRRGAPTCALTDVRPHRRAPSPTCALTDVRPETPLKTYEIRG
ncbi:MAG: hypothetical protein RIE73_18775 [Coleofasciculus sp. C1-SOL-03]|uniref:hypothetical protein n=1 Tax=Coleofasciculus sp. C1-SOL-03 TaxID=3069522 RepID=UPI0033034835